MQSISIRHRLSCAMSLSTIPSVTGSSAADTSGTLDGVPAVLPSDAPIITSEAATESSSDLDRQGRTWQRAKWIIQPEKPGVAIRTVQTATDEVTEAAYRDLQRTLTKGRNRSSASKKPKLDGSSCSTSQLADSEGSNKPQQFDFHNTP